MLRHATTGVIHSPFLGVVILGMLASCARSEYPLSSLEDGFVDPYLLGTWYAVSIDEEGMIDTPDDTVYEASIGDDGYLWVTGQHKSGGRNISSGHSTQLGANKFLNLKDEECRGCGDLATWAASSPECPYHIYQYTTFVPGGFASGLREYAEFPTDELEGWVKDKRGQLVFLRGMPGDLVKESIASGDIEGDTVMLDPYASMCIRSTGDALRAFVARAAKGSAMFEWALFSRTSLRGKALDGIAIGTPRRVLVRELLEKGCRGPDTIIVENADEIITLGYAQSEDGHRVKRFKLEDRRLAEVSYMSPDTASLFAHAAYQITEPVHLADRERSWREWYKEEKPEQYYLPLLQCIESLDLSESKPSSIEGASKLLADCMKEKGWTLSNAMGTSMPVCKGLEP